MLGRIDEGTPRSGDERLYDLSGLPTKMGVLLSLLRAVDLAREGREVPVVTTRALCSHFSSPVAERSPRVPGPKGAYRPLWSAATRASRTAAPGTGPAISGRRS